MAIAPDITALVGSTPLVRLNRLPKPAAALRLPRNWRASIPRFSERPHRCGDDPRGGDTGRIAPDRTVLVEPTSGNTGTAPAMVRCLAID